jgi:hypothetical protein
MRGLFSVLTLLPSRASVLFRSWIPKGGLGWLALLTLVALVLVGVFRPQLPEFLRDHWATIVITLGVAAAFFRLLRLRLVATKDPFPQVLAAIFSLALVVLYLQPQRVASDGIYYYSTLRSVVVDRDLDFENEYRVLGAPEGYFHRTETGRLPNNFSVGPALLWAPAYLLVHGLALAGLLRPTGFGYPYFTMVSTVTAFGGFLGVLWLYRLARYYFEAPIAFASSLLMWLGTFHLWYMIFEPSMSHAFGMATVTGFLLLCHREPSGLRGFALAGVAAGIVILVRWQNVFFLPVGLAVCWLRGPRPQWKGLAVFTVAVLATFLPQMIFWNLVYGHFLLVPQGGNYLRWGEAQIEAVLFSSRHGLLSWSPLLWIGIVGLTGLVGRAPVFAGAMLVALAAAVYTNALAADWWAGASFGARRFDGALPAFGLGLAMAMEWLVPWFRRHALVVVTLVLAPFLLWNMSLMGIYALGVVPFDGAVSFRQAGADALELVYRVTGYPFSWPGAWAERLRRGTPLAAYDLAGAKHVSNNVEIRMGDTDALYLGRGWSLPQRKGARTEREVAQDGARIYVALREPSPYVMRLEGRSAGELDIRMNRRALGKVRPGREGQSPENMVPADAIAAGLNEIGLFPTSNGRVFIFRVTLVRPGEP